MGYRSKMYEYGRAIKALNGINDESFTTISADKNDGTPQYAHYDWHAYHHHDNGRGVLLAVSLATQLSR